jgi:drug/metabolite transporter (DMT)-like permease
LAYVSVAAGLTAAFCWGTADYLSRSQSEKLGYYKTVIYSHVVTLAVLVALVPVVDPDLVVSAAPVLVLGVAGVVNLVAFIFLYRAFHRGVVSVVAPVAYTYPAVTAVLSVVILGTAISAQRVLAIAAVVTGVMLLSTRFSQLRAFLAGRGSANLTVGVGSALGSSVLFAVVYVGIGYAAPLVSLVVPAIVLRAVAIAAGFLLAPFIRQDARPSRLVFSNKIIAMGVLEAAGWLAFTTGVQSTGGSLPIVAAIAGMGGAVATTYGLVFLKERLDPNQIAGVLLALVGVFALLYLGG